MNNREVKNSGLTADDLYEKDLIDAIVNYGNAKRDLKRAQKEAGTWNAWEHPSTWLWVAVAVYVVLCVLFR